MPKITYIQQSGARQEVDAADGDSVMEAAANAGVPGIIGDCGGCLSCATCHVYVDEAWLNRLAPAETMEKDLLEGALEVRESSRLGCQIRLKPELDGLIVHVPVSQF